MAHHLSAKKRMRQNKKRRMRNKNYSTLLRSRTKVLRTAIEEKNLQEAEKLLPAVIKVIQKVGSKGVIHSNSVSRRVSRLTKAVNGLKASKK